MMATNGNAANDNSSNLVDEFESSFQSCLSILTNPGSNYIHDVEEIKTSVDQTIQRFMENAKQMECFFLQKRLFLAVHKPEQMIGEDINELKNEIQRKDQVLARYHDKIATWQAILNDQPIPHQGPLGGPPPPGMPQQPGGAMLHGGQQRPHMPPGVMGQGPPGMPVRGQMSSVQQPQMGHMNMGAGQGQPQHMMGPQGSPMIGAGPQGSPMVAQGGQMGHFGPGQGGHPQGTNLQGPLAYLERTTSNIGMPDTRR
ncbi:Mediator of RNA polymerase II transcription subunit 28 [Halotydeus destructor]|nr:Mediator of RNA polymerase II transcription subunit 28 [Halotydeus destructor]